MAEDFLPGIWELPGGHKEPWETCLEALHREMREELGRNIDLAAAIPCHVFDYAYEVDHGRVSTVHITYLLASQVAFQPQLTEHDEAAWKEKGELASLEISPDTRSAIESAYDLHAGGWPRQTRALRIED